MPYDVDDHLAHPRLGGLTLSPDGERLVTAVTRLHADRNQFTTALWELDPDDQRTPRRLTRSAAGEQSAAFLPDGTLLFVSQRTDPEVTGEQPVRPAGLWALPAGGGEAAPVAALPGEVRQLTVARAAGTVVALTDLHPDATSMDEDAATETVRRDEGTSALLLEGYPIRSWDRHLGPRVPRLVVVPEVGSQVTGTAGDPAAAARVGPRVLTPPGPDGPGPLGLHDAGIDVTPDGRTVVTTWRVGDPNHPYTRLVALDVVTGAARVVVDDPGSWALGPACSPDGRSVAYLREEHGTPERSPRVTLWVVDLESGRNEPVLPAQFDLWPRELVWAADGSAVLFTADERGHAPVFRVTPRGGSLTRLTAAGAYTDLCPHPDGRRIVALRSGFDCPPAPVSLAVRSTDQTPAQVRFPGVPVPGTPAADARVQNGPTAAVAAGTPVRGGQAPAAGAPTGLPGRVEEVRARAEDGTPLRGWLVLPEETAAPAPLVVWIHGGPLRSWNEWNWRWNPYVLTARGYAVLLPDPTPSTGYGQAFADRGRGSWGERPFTDLMAMVDAAVARSDVDAGRTAVMGGSFGGYLANWVAGHTDRFRCVVTHASLWDLEQFGGTTDEAVFWEQEFGRPETDRDRYVRHSPSRSAGAIRTPMLVVHGARDYRVPESEMLRLWRDLTRHGVEARLLYFPDEHHWVLRPPNVRVWYRTVLAFLDEHVLGRPWVRPPGV